ncbi:hypothetical protein PZ892_16530 [Sphingobacterium sp. WM]|uniref:hypothetical protein n=1 Tax=Sphingobacterium sp. WM TaxID=3031802 RepID=UPI00240DE445|nr:hypothetical protein [Sphingobacterium sp. WM]WFB63266.1 hypothetical protein PZ892_16530 [Sphingobacterium sp. WM]
MSTLAPDKQKSSSSEAADLVRDQRNVIINSEDPTMECNMREFHFGQPSNLPLSKQEVKELTEVRGEDPKCNIVFP